MNWNKLATASIDDLIAWAEPQAWCRAMAACLQDSEWHSEGDVWTHTRLVLRELEQLDDWDSLSPHDQVVLKFTALLHDVAKPITTEIHAVTGRVTSPKHAVEGEHVARAILREAGCDLSTREEIRRLVRYHGRPAFLMEREEPTLEVVRLSWLVNNRLLFLFAVADTRGRDTDAMSRPEENLLYWKLAAEEAGCFDQPFPFANDQSRFVFGGQSKPNLHYVAHEEFSCEVTMMCGLPGSGKDTWLAAHRGDRSVVSLDQLRDELGVDPKGDQGRVVQLAKERCRELLRSRTSFAFNATNVTRQTRQGWIELFSDYGARIEMVYVEPPVNVILKQNRERQKVVPESVIRKLANKCEPPTWWECHDLALVG